ncbi:MAG: hypothetical protein HKM26_08335 [Winogradskyella sp.]|nr:hypothetical protein [Winogradskyella sp.]
MIYVHDRNSSEFKKLRNKAMCLSASKFDISRKADYKYYVVYNNRTIHIGHKKYSDFSWHKDEQRKKRYQARHKAILKKDGKPAYLDPNQKAYWSYWLLWD